MYWLWMYTCISISKLHVFFFQGEKGDRGMTGSKGELGAFVSIRIGKYAIGGRSSLPLRCHRCRFTRNHCACAPMLYTSEVCDDCTVANEIDYAWTSKPWQQTRGHGEWYHTPTAYCHLVYSQLVYYPFCVIAQPRFSELGLGLGVGIRVRVLV